MSIIANPADSKLKIVLNAGVDEKNKPVVKSKTYSNIKPTASNENLYNLGVDLSGLQIYELTNIIKYEESELLNEPEE